MQLKASSLHRAQDELQNACVFLKKPFTDCYCMNLSSSNISKMLAFCTGDFPACPIYRQKGADRENPGSAGASKGAIK